MDVEVGNDTKTPCNQPDACCDEFIAWCKHQLGLMSQPVHASTKITVITSQETPDHTRQCAQDSTNHKEDARHGPDEQESNGPKKFSQLGE